MTGLDGPISLKMSLLAVKKCIRKFFFQSLQTKDEHSSEPINYDAEIPDFERFPLQLPEVSNVTGLALELRVWIGVWIGLGFWLRLGLMYRAFGD